MKREINYNLAGGNTSLEIAPLEISHTTFQFIHSVTTGTATATLMQSLDGLHFDNVTDINGDNFAVDLAAGETSATINAVELHSRYYRIDITASGVVGTLTYLYVH